MKIIGGDKKGFQINTVSSEGMRPTTGKVREAFFSSIQFDVEDSLFLDLFSGSGGIGLEALSRKSGRSVFIEKCSKVYRVLKQNIQLLDYQKKSEAYCKDVYIGVSILHQKNRVFDIIFIDPPYNKGHVAKIVNLLDEKNLLNTEGKIFLEHHYDEKIPQELNQLVCKETRKYGNTCLSIFQLKESFPKNMEEE